MPSALPFRPTNIMYLVHNISIIVDHNDLKADSDVILIAESVAYPLRFRENNFQLTFRDTSCSCSTWFATLRCFGQGQNSHKQRVHASVLPSTEISPSPSRSLKKFSNTTANNCVPWRTPSSILIQSLNNLASEVQQLFRPSSESTYFGLMSNLWNTINCHRCFYRDEYLL